MAHYAFLDENNIVQKVLVGLDENNLSELPSGFESFEEYYSNVVGMVCKRTSYNTQHNTHILDGVVFRGNFAGKGYTYDEVNDVFLEPKPFDSWILDETTWSWQPPVAMPELTEEQIAANNYYTWNENTTSWDLVE